LKIAHANAACRNRNGVVRSAALGTYDNFNIAVDGLDGHLVAGIDLTYDTLLAPSLDEVSAEYELLADAVRTRRISRR
jgi:microcin C transport system substrate-binding protein